MATQGNYAVVLYEHESIYTVTAYKLFAGTWYKCKRKIIELRTRGIFDTGIGFNFEGEEVNAMYFQDFINSID